MLGIRSTIYFDTIQFFLVIFGLIVIGFSVYDLVGGWDLLNESLSRISNLKQKLFNLNINYESYLSIPGTIKFSEILDTSKYNSGIWTSSMILSFSFALAGIQMSPNFSMLTFASKEVKPFTYNAITAASQIGQDLHVLVIGYNADEVAKSISQVPSEKKVIQVDNQIYENYIAENVTSTIIK